MKMSITFAIWLGMTVISYAGPYTESILNDDLTDEERITSIKRAVTVEKEEFIKEYPKILELSDDKVVTEAIRRANSILAMNHQMEPGMAHTPQMMEHMKEKSAIVEATRKKLAAEDGAVRDQALKLLISAEDEETKGIVVNDLESGKGNFKDTNYVSYLAGDPVALRKVLGAKNTEVVKSAMVNAAVYPELANEVAKKWVDPSTNEDLASAAGEALSTYAPEFYASVVDLVAGSDTHSKERREKAVELLNNSLIQINPEEQETLYPEVRKDALIKTLEKDDIKVDILDQKAIMDIRQGGGNPLK